MSNESTAAAPICMPEQVSPASREHFLEMLRSSLAPGPSEVVVECGSIDTVTSTHIGLLWETKEICGESGIPFRLGNPTDAMRRVLRVMDLEGIFEKEQDAEIGIGTDPTLQTLAESARFSDSIDASLDGVQESLARFIIFLAGLTLPHDDAYQLQTAYYEIAANIVTHGGLGSGMTVDVLVIAEPHRISIEFRDNGVAFDPTRHSYCDDFRAAAKQGAIRGFGLGMVHRLIDTITYRRVGDTTNVLSLTKKWSRT